MQTELIIRLIKSDRVRLQASTQHPVATYEGENNDTRPWGRYVRARLRPRVYLAGTSPIIIIYNILCVHTHTSAHDIFIRVNTRARGKIYRRKGVGVYYTIIGAKLVAIIMRLLCYYDVYSLRRRLSRTDNRFFPM